MLKTVSSITNALGALNYTGTWDANANTPTLTSSVGVKGDYYVVATAGTTSLNGISNWGVGDWAVFNGSVWQRVEGGADVNCVNFSSTGTGSFSNSITVYGLRLGRDGGVKVETNTAFGYASLSQGTYTGTSSTAMGWGTMFFAGATASDNCAYGASSLFNLTTGNSNTAIGKSAGSALTTGVLNTVLGHSSGNNITTGARNVVVGGGNAASAATVSDEIIVGYGLTGKGADTAFIGGTNGAYNEKNVTTWETTSDERVKRNIQDSAIGLKQINALQVRDFQYREKDDVPKDAEGNPVFVAHDTQTVITGVIAQELEQVLPNAVKTQSNGLMSVNIDPIIWALVNSVKELSARVEILENQLKGE